MACQLSMQVTIEAATERLLRRTSAALTRATLDEHLDRVSRLLDAGRLTEVQRPASAVPKLVATIRLRDFAELALLDAVSIADDPRLDTATKGRRLDEVFALAGL